MGHPPFALGEAIFKDRRKAQQSGTDKPEHCRRRHDMRNSDATPWWLKVNYVSHQLDLIDGGNSDSI